MVLMPEEQDGGLPGWLEPGQGSGALGQLDGDGPLAEGALLSTALPP